MQNIVFQKIRVENFRKYTEAELDFENGLTAVIGPNGAGKSTYFMAVMAVLYGRTAEGIAITELVNKKVGRNLLIELTLKIDDQDWIIRRAYKHKQYGSKVYLIKIEDGKEADQTEKTTTETYEKIENLLIPREVFLNTIYFSQQVKEFFTSLTNSNQKAIFDSILQLHEWGDYKEKATKACTEMHEDILKTEGQNSHMISVIPEKEANIEAAKESVELQKKKQAEDKAELLVSIEQNQNELAKNDEKIKDIGYDESEHQTKAKVVSDLKSQNAAYQMKEDSEISEATMHYLNVTIPGFESGTEKSISEAKELAHANFAKMKEVSDKSKELINSEKAKATKSFDDQLAQNQIDEAEKKTSINAAKSNLVTRRSIFMESHNVAEVKSKFQIHISDIETEKASLKAKSESITDKVKQVITVREKAEASKKELDEALNKDTVICTLCGQEVSDEKHIQKEIDKLQKDIIAAQDEETKLRDTFAELKEKFLELTAKSKKYQKEGTDALNEVQAEIESYDQKAQVANDALDKELKDALAEFERKRQTIQNDKKEVEKEFFDKLEQLDIVLQKSADEVKEEFQKVKTDLEKILEEAKVEAKIGFDKKIAEIKSKYLKLRNDNDLAIIDLVVELDELQKKSDSAKFLEQNKIVLVERISSLKQHIDTLDKKVIDDAPIKKAEEDLKDAKAQLVEIEKELNTKRKRLDILEFWKVGFSSAGIPSMLIDSSIPFMNKTIKEELEKIVPGRFVVSFDTLSQTKGGDIRDKFSVNILNLETGADRHDLLSGGEKRIIDVCCLRVLRLLAENLYQKKFNVTFLDEVLDSIDNENSRTFCSALRKVSDDQNVTLISHAVDKIGEVDRILRML